MWKKSSFILEIFGFPVFQFSGGFFYWKLIFFIGGGFLLLVVFSATRRSGSDGSPWLADCIHSKSGSYWSLNSANFFNFPPNSRLRTRNPLCFHSVQRQHCQFSPDHVQSLLKSSINTYKCHIFLENVLFYDKSYKISWFTHICREILLSWFTYFFRQFFDL